MNEMGQQPLFMIREGQDDLDAALAAKGYKVIDPVYARMCPVSNLTDLPIPRVTAFATRIRVRDVRQAARERWSGRPLPMWSRPLR